MKGIGQLFVGLVTALGSTLLVLAAASLALMEGSLGKLPTLAVPTPMVDGIVEQTLTPTITGAPTATQVKPTACPTPEGWVEYIVQYGDTIQSLAEQYGTTPETLMLRNCMSSPNLVPAAILRLPAVIPTNTPVPALPTVEPTFTDTAIPTPTRTINACGPPRGWVPYIVRPGDTLFRLGLALNLSVQQLQFANCLSSDRIYAGQRLYVPFYPPVLPTYTRTPLPPTATEEVVNTPVDTPVTPDTPYPPPPDPTTAVPPSPEPTIPIEPTIAEPTAASTAAGTGDIAAP